MFSRNRSDSEDNRKDAHYVEMYKVFLRTVLTGKLLGRLKCKILSVWLCQDQCHLTVDIFMTWKITTILILQPLWWTPGGSIIVVYQITRVSLQNWVGSPKWRAKINKYKKHKWVSYQQINNKKSSFRVDYNSPLIEKILTHL